MKTQLATILVFFIYASATQTTVASNFNAARPFHLPTAANTVVAGDFNNDGVPDLIVGRAPDVAQQGGNISALIGNGNGIFQPERKILVGVNPAAGEVAPYIAALKAADLNADNNLDIIVVHNASPFSFNTSRFFISILFGNGNGTFQVPEPYYLALDSYSQMTASSVTVGDYTGDGKPDIIVGCGSGLSVGLIYVMRNNGNGGFEVLGLYTLIAYAFDLTSGDFNNDSHLDLALATARGIIVAYGAGDFSFPAVEQRDNNQRDTAIAAGDFNRDNKLDLAVADIDAPGVKVFLNTANGFPFAPAAYSISGVPGDVQIADFNNDGNLDLATYATNSRIIKLLYNSGSGAFENAVNAPSGSYPFALTAADFNLDGKTDIAAANNDTSPREQFDIILNAPNPQRYYGDFDGDRKTDIGVFRPSSGTWHILRSRDASYFAQNFGLATDKLVPGDYDADGRADIAVFRNGVWYILRSSDGGFTSEFWGTAGDIPVPADYDNGGAMNIAVFRPSNGTWYVRNRVSGFKSVGWGLSDDKPVPADYDGDGSADITVFRPNSGIWYSLLSSNSSFRAVQFGQNEDKPVQGDYDFDGKADLAVFRASNGYGYWYILNSSNNSFRGEQFGLGDDVPVVGDFTGDGKTDVSVFRPNHGSWFIQSNQGKSAFKYHWGINGDVASSFFP